MFFFILIGTRWSVILKYYMHRLLHGTCVRSVRNVVRCRNRGGRLDTTHNARSCRRDAVHDDHHGATVLDCIYIRDRRTRRRSAGRPCLAGLRSQAAAVMDRRSHGGRMDHDRMLRGSRKHVSRDRRQSYAACIIDNTS